MDNIGHNAHFWGAIYGIVFTLLAVPDAFSNFINTQLWSKEDDIDIFYFSSFDEAWKKDDEGDVGAFWGLWDVQEKLKY